MGSMEKAQETLIRNIEAKTGKSLEELLAHVRASLLTKHSELVKMMKEDFELGHGQANTLVHLAKQPPEQSGATSSEDAVTIAEDTIYSGKQEALRPLHDKLMAQIHKLGDFEIAPKKKYLSLRRKKQFATIGPGSKGRLEVGLNVKDLEPTERLEQLPAGKMCHYRIYVGEVSEVDQELLDWIKAAFASAG